MKPLNYKDRKKQKFTFYTYFGLTLLLLFVCSAITLITAQKGISLLENKKAQYDAVFKKQAELNFQLDQLFRDLNNLKNKPRNSSEHKQMQKLITGGRLLMENDIYTTEEKEKYYLLYIVLLEQVKAAQATIDMLERENNQRLYNIDQLEKCRLKYQEITKQKNN